MVSLHGRHMPHPCRNSAFSLTLADRRSVSMGEFGAHLALKMSLHNFGSAHMRDDRRREGSVPPLTHLSHGGDYCRLWSRASHRFESSRGIGHPRLASRSHRLVPHHTLWASAGELPREALLMLFINKPSPEVSTRMRGSLLEAGHNSFSAPPPHPTPLEVTAQRGFCKCAGVARFSPSSAVSTWRSFVLH